MSEPIDPPIVDCHAHVFPTPLPRADSAWTHPDYAFSYDDYIRQLDHHGVHFGIIAGISVAGTYNDYMLAALHKHKRLRGTAIVDPKADRYTLDRMRDDGVVGVRLQLARRDAPPDLSGEAYQLLLRRIADLDWHVQINVEGRYLAAVLDQLVPWGVKAVVDHFGRPEVNAGVNCAGFQALLRAVSRGRTWVKLSAAYRLTWLPAGQTTRDPVADRIATEIAPVLFREAGPERLLWGSDCPFVGHEQAVTYQDTLDDFVKWIPDARSRRKISDTALKLFYS